ARARAGGRRGDAAGGRRAGCAAAVDARVAAAGEGTDARRPARGSATDGGALLDAALGATGGIGTAAGHPAALAAGRLRGALEDVECADRIEPVVRDRRGDDGARTAQERLRVETPGAIALLLRERADRLHVGHVVRAGAGGEG